MSGNNSLKLSEIIDYKLNSFEKNEILQEALNIFKINVSNAINEKISQKNFDTVLIKACKELYQSDFAFIIENTSKLCENCGKCCHLADPITLTLEDIMAIKKLLGFETFNTFIRIQNGNFYFKQTQPCYFLKKNQCSIYEARPFVCKIFPFTQLENGKHALCKYEFCNFIKNFLIIRVFWELFNLWMGNILLDQSNSD